MYFSHQQEIIFGSLERVVKHAEFGYVSVKIKHIWMR